MPCNIADFLPGAWADRDPAGGGVADQVIERSAWPIRSEPGVLHVALDGAAPLQQSPHSPGDLLHKSLQLHARGRRYMGRAKAAPCSSCPGAMDRRCWHHRTRLSGRPRRRSADARRDHVSSGDRAALFSRLCAARTRRSLRRSARIAARGRRSLRPSVRHTPACHARPARGVGIRRHAHRPSGDDGEGRGDVAGLSAAACAAGGYARAAAHPGGWSEGNETQQGHAAITQPGCAVLTPKKYFPLCTQVCRRATPNKLSRPEHSNQKAAGSGTTAEVR